MKRYSGFEAKKTTTRELLPAGGYVAKIMGAEELHYGWGDVVLISFDILEGEYKDFFARDYRAQDREDKKWRGTYRLSEPKDDGTEKDSWTKRTFNNAVAVLEESNTGYHWDWTPIERGDFSQLKGNAVGVLFRNKEWAIEGKTGWTTECCALTAVDDIRESRFKMPKDKPLQSAQRSSKPLTAETLLDEGGEIVSDDDLPF